MRLDCHCGPDLRSPSPRVTARCISPDGIRSIAGRKRLLRRQPCLKYAKSITSDRHRRKQMMRDVFVRLGTDFLSTIVFLLVYLATDSIVLATSVAIASAIGQMIHARLRGRTLGFMAWASLALVVVLGSATLLTHDPRFVLAKPAIAHFG